MSEENSVPDAPEATDEPEEAHLDVEGTALHAHGSGGGAG
jgi:hypothetical protein